MFVSSRLFAAAGETRISAMRDALTQFFRVACAVYVDFRARQVENTNRADDRAGCALPAASGSRGACARMNDPLRRRHAAERRRF